MITARTVGKAVRALSSSAAKETGSPLVNYAILAGIGGAGMMVGIQAAKMPKEQASQVFDSDEVTSYMW
eukprot:CAMPEP_0114127824 /NCGR_PEP_ID=MMETSP0043_2-20121206/10602_1 /TAXON_ID=464988 /ORGANISM="Hemiselmis andersenii, Strain CCMP644" /LENGTH=68 /DNA_ID=CAMNT_0001220967 /DNA_START=130 /DNA_END=336 /DNA_ORIENTATION=+